MKKLFTFILALAASAGTLLASNTKVGDIWYDFDESSNTASVTYQGYSSYTYSNEYSGSVVIPSSVTYNGKTYSITSIGNSAFKDCTGLTSVTISNSVTSIGNYAFSGCTGLTSITIPNSVTSIGNSAFSGCTSLISITIPNSVTSIGANAIRVCTSLTSVKIGNSVTSIGENAFEYCTSLTSITIPNSVTEIGSSAFGDCTSLTSITVPNSVTSMGNYIFYNCSKLTFVSISNSVTSIGNCAFSGCSSLTSITIPNSVTSIGRSAFADCSSLTSVTIPNSVTSIGDYAFSGCTGLTSVTVMAFTPPTLGSDAFNDVSKSIPLYVPIARMSKYQGWGGFTNIQPVVVYGTSGDNLTWTFDNGKLTISGIGDMTSHPWIEYKNYISSVVVDAGVTSIGDYAFEDCYNLTSVTIPNSVTSIGESAFSECDGLTSVTIPNSVTSIGKGAFLGCTGLTSVAIPNSVTSIGDSAFMYCDRLTSITIPNSVTSIGEDAFFSCTGLTSVTIPNSVISIGKGAFALCSGLTSIKVDAANPKYCSLYGVLFNKAQTSLIQYPSGKQGSSYIIPNSVTNIGAKAFYYCIGFTSMTIPNSVTSIGDYAFEDCQLLTSVTIPNSVTSIGDYAFRDCDRLTSITIPNSVTSIADGTFDGCRRLRSVIIPNSVTSIGIYAFSGCISLTSVTIPNSVTSIGDYAFSIGKDWTSVTCEAVTPPIIGKDVFSYASSGKTLYVPVGSFDAYRGWGNFTWLKPISAASASVTTNTTSDITESSVTISWPQVVGANRYVIEVRLNDIIVCTITFNNMGQLLSNTFAAPSLLRGKENIAAQTLANGWQYTVNGLDAGKTYTYSVIAKNEAGTTIDTKSGTFKTIDWSGLDDILSAPNTADSKKVIINGQVYLLRGDKIYTLSGQELK